jgi:hypothetical protein
MASHLAVHEADRDTPLFPLTPEVVAVASPESHRRTEHLFKVSANAFGLVFFPHFQQMN